MAYFRQVLDVVFADVQLLKIYTEGKVCQTGDFINTENKMRIYYNVSDTVSVTEYSTNEKLNLTETKYDLNSIY